MILESKIDYVEARRKHVCSICREQFYWNHDSSWYGILEDKKGSQKILEKCCSTNCKNKSKWNGKYDDTF